MRLFEFEAKNVLKAFGICVPDGVVLKDSDGLRCAYKKVGPDVVLKSQIPTGARMKAGGIEFVGSEDEAAIAFEKLYGAKIKDFKVNQILLEENLPFQKEYYLGITYDQSAKMPAVVFSVQGGIDVEQSSAGSFNTIHWDLSQLLPEYKCRELLIPFSFDGGKLLNLARIVHKLARVFYTLDATLVEVNPLVAAERGFCALDCHIELDEDALYRHKNLIEEYGIDLSLSRSKDTDSEVVARAEEIDREDHRGVAGRVVEFDGDMGLLIGGGGASLVVFDAIKTQGGRPANYCEIGGNPSVSKITKLTKLLLSQPRVKKIAVIMNVVNNTRVDLVARGVIKAIVESGYQPTEKISVFRIPGAWEEEGCKILKKYGIRLYGRDTSIDKAASIAVEEM